MPAWVDINRCRIHSDKSTTSFFVRRWERREGNNTGLILLIGLSSLNMSSSMFLHGFLWNICASDWHSPPLWLVSFVLSFVFCEQVELFKESLMSVIESNFSPSFFHSFFFFLFCPERRDGIYQLGDTNCWSPRAKHHVYLDQYGEASRRSALVLVTSSIAIYHSPASITCLLSLAVCVEWTSLIQIDID